jgi:hypothetical protein
MKTKDNSAGVLVLLLPSIRVHPRSSAAIHFFGAD